MPTTPFAKLQMIVNSGGAVSGGIVVANGASIQLTAQSFVGWGVGGAVAKWEIYAKTGGLTVPAGWSTAGDGTFFWLGNSNPPAFNMPAAPYFGKLLFRLTVDNGFKNGVFTPVGGVDSCIDESSGLEVLGPNGIHSLAFNEGVQFNGATSWSKTIDDDVRKLAASASSMVTLKSFGAVGDGVTDDSAALQTALTTCASSGFSLFIDGATFKILQQIIFPSNVEVIASPKARIVTNIGGAVIGASLFVTQEQAQVTAGTVSSASVPGDKVIRVAGGGTWVVGNYVMLKSTANTLFQAVYRIINVTGGGPFTLTTDRPIEWVFSVNDVAKQVSTIPNNIRWEGNGMTMSGATPSYFAFQGGARDVSVAGIRFDAAVAGPAAGYIIFDHGSVDCGMRDITIDGALVGGVANTFAAPTKGGLGFCGEHLVGQRLRVSNVNAPAPVHVGNCFDLELYDVDVRDCTLAGSFGIRFTTGNFSSNAGAGVPSRDSYVFGGSVVGCSAGISFANAQRCGSYGLSTDFNTNVGITFDGGSTECLNNFAEGGSSVGNGAQAISTIAGALGTRVRDVDCTSSTGAVLARADLSASGLKYSSAAANIGVDAANAIALRLTDSDLSVGACAAVSCAANVNASIDNCSLAAATAGGIGITTTGAGGTIDVSRTKITAPGTAKGVVLGGGTWNFGLDVDLTAVAGTALQYTAGTINWVRTGGITSISAPTTGNIQLTYNQCVPQAIETTAALTGALGVFVQFLPGALFLLVNSTSNAFAVTFKVLGDVGAGVVVAQGKVAWGRVNTAGTALVRVTPDQ